MSKRIFIAVDIAPQRKLIQFFYDLQKHFSKEKIKWVHQDNMHLTLKFIGETDEEKISEISRIIAEIVKNYNEFELEIRAVGVFPNAMRPRVIWCGVENTKVLEQIAEEINQKLQNFDIQAETKPFKAHLTLGRIKFLRNTNRLRDILEKYKDYKFQKQKIKSVILYESILRPQGPEYRPLEVFNLKK